MKFDETDKIKIQKLNVENTITELQSEIENETLVAEKIKIQRLPRRLYLIFGLSVKKRITEIAKIA